jgi:hypothetical protein
LIGDIYLLNWDVKTVLELPDRIFWIAGSELRRGISPWNFHVRNVPVGIFFVEFSCDGLVKLNNVACPEQKTN